MNAFWLNYSCKIVHTSISVLRLQSEPCCQQQHSMAGVNKTFPFLKFSRAKWKRKKQICATIYSLWWMFGMIDEKCKKWRRKQWKKTHTPHTTSSHCVHCVQRSPNTKWHRQKEISPNFRALSQKSDTNCFHFVRFEILFHLRFGLRCGFWFSSDFHHFVLRAFFCFSSLFWLLIDLL